MDTCLHWIQHTAKDIGKTYKSKCIKPVYKDGLCKKHYDKKITKSILFKDRHGYIEPTMKELKSGRLLYLAKAGSHGGFRYVKGVIVNFTSGKKTNLPIDTQYFVIKIN